MRLYKLGFNTITNQAYVITDGTFPIGASDLGQISVPDILANPTPSFTLYHIIRDKIYLLGEFDMEVIDIAPPVGEGIPGDNSDIIPPTITSTGSVSIFENTPFSLNLTANEAVTWSLNGGADVNLFTINGSTLNMAAKNYESPVDLNSDNIYNVVVRATDLAGNVDNKSISVTIMDINENIPDITAPTITSASSATVLENTVFNLTLTANENVTWTKNGGTDAALFNLSGSTLTLPTKDFEVPTDSNSDNVYSITIRATDAAGNFTNQTINITITNVDEATTPVPTENLDFTDPENSGFLAAIAA